MADYFRRFAARLIRQGALEVEEADGTHYILGDGCADPPLVKFTDAGVTRALLRDPELTFGELFMDGRILVLRGSIYDVLAVVIGNLERAGPTPLLSAIRHWRDAARRFVSNNLGRARTNVVHHYDIGNALYALFLDSDWQYSCAYFPRGDEDIDAAQLAKKRHIAAKLYLDKPGLKVLDIGCGWGGMALYLARTAGAHVTGVTLSREQWTLARERSVAAGSDRQVEFRLQDYRQVTERFDRIVSVGMLEHVGLGGYRTFFAKVAECLDEDGIALIHTIGAPDGNFRVGPWSDKYIFPGSHIPSLSQLLPAIERAGLIVTDIEVLRLHYARTLKLWRENFLANRDRARALFDERFCRMWEFYLAIAQCMFEYQRCSVFQLQLAKRIDALPITRDYVAAG